MWSLTSRRLMAVSTAPARMPIGIFIHSWTANSRTAANHASQTGWRFLLCAPNMDLSLVISAQTGNALGQRALVGEVDGKNRPGPVEITGERKSLGSFCFWGCLYVGHECPTP